MTAGLNLICTVYRFSYPNDDEVGGAVPSGTALYTSIPCRVQSNKPTLALVEQGLETETTYSAVLHPGTLVIEHNDQILITSPSISSLYNKRFRVIGVQHTSTRDDLPNSFVFLTLKRSEEAHADSA